MKVTYLKLIFAILTVFVLKITVADNLIEQNKRVPSSKVEVQTSFNF